MAAQQQQAIKLGSDGWELFANDNRVVVQWRRKKKKNTRRRTDGRSRNNNKAAPTSSKNSNGEPKRWTVLSSAVLGGGLRSFSADEGLQVLNAKVPADYDGVTPEPASLLQELARNDQRQRADDAVLDDDGDDDDDGFCFLPTVGMLTAASMNSLRVATQRVEGDDSTSSTRISSPPSVVTVVDAIVTAGISNSRAAGADADVFSIYTTPAGQQGGEEAAAQCASSSDSSGKNNNAPSAAPPAGTINTVLLVDGAPLTESAMVEALAVAGEAKCAACADLGIVCAKTGQPAQGTGTDCTVLVVAAADSSSNNPKQQNNNKDHLGTRVVVYAGKHTLLGEMVGQVVFQATREALLANLCHIYGSPTRYRLACSRREFVRALQVGHRPFIPYQPMKPVPRPQGWVLLVGLTGVLLAYWVSNGLLSAASSLPSPTEPSRSVLVAALIWDRFLGTSLLLPIGLHPVVLVGRMISAFVRFTPQVVFDTPALGFMVGCLLFLGTLSVSLATAWSILTLPDTVASHILLPAAPAGDYSVWATTASFVSPDFVHRTVSPFVAWLLQVVLVKSSLSLQLLCSVALQMAHFLERRKITNARQQLSWLCSRDPSSLQSNELAAATLESLAENLSDSLVSPIFWYVLWGPLGAFAFRVANTLDSRVGIRGGMLEWVGKTSARCDDLLNLLPARLTALLLALAAGAVWGPSAASQGLRVAWRDASQCDSPNAGWPMGAMAGVLRVALEKKGQYCLGAKDALHRPGPHEIRTGHVLAQLAGAMAALLAIVSISLLTR